MYVSNASFKFKKRFINSKTSRSDNQIRMARLRHLNSFRSLSFSFNFSSRWSISSASLISSLQTYRRIERFPPGCLIERQLVVSGMTESRSFLISTCRSVVTSSFSSLIVNDPAKDRYNSPTSVNNLVPKSTN
jgi:hypothetical protein